MAKISNYFKNRYEDDQAEFREKINRHRRFILYRILIAIAIVVAAGLVMFYNYKNMIYTDYTILRTLEYEESTTASYLKFNNNFLRYSVDGISAFNIDNKMLWNQPFEMQNPIVDVCGDYVAVGDYKKRANVVGGRETSKPSEVHKHMMTLLESYNAKKNVTVEDIIALHAEFEYIHPFQDGNGRVGRLIALKECLRHNVIPFIIEDEKKSYYYRGLSEWRNEKGWLTDTCLDGQDTFIRLMDMLEIR